MEGLPAERLADPVGTSDEDRRVAFPARTDAGRDRPTDDRLWAVPVTLADDDQGRRVASIGVGEVLNSSSRKLAAVSPHGE